MQKVTVIVPYKEDRGFLNEALESLEAQTLKDFELILSQSDNTAGYNMNRGIEKANGKYVCYLCDDDLLTPDSLQVRFEFMEANNFDFIHSKGYKLHSNGTTSHYDLTNPYAEFNSVLMNNGIMGGSTMYKTDVLLSNPFDENLTTAEEWELHLRLLSKDYKLGYLDKYTYLYRIWSGQKSIGNRSNEYQAKRNIVKEQIRMYYAKKNIL